MKKVLITACISSIVAIIAVLAAIFIMVYKRNNLDSSDYVAAVVEYHPVIQDSPKKTILENAIHYEAIIKTAGHYDVDIIVFPEAGLTGIHIPHNRISIREYLIEVPSPESRTIPYMDDRCSQILKKLSFAAKTNRIYVAVNLFEILYCSREEDPDCPEDGAYYYNTNVVFNRHGAIVARYRKFNLFGEKGFNHPKEPEICTFKTDFGVTFGMFICFDILFPEPSVRLVKEEQVTDIIYSTAWFSEFPLLTAVSVQAAWSYSMDVNVLAANYNNPQSTSGGSGIYAGTKGPLVVLMPENVGTNILIAKVPKKNYDTSVIQYMMNLEEELTGKSDDREKHCYILPACTSLNGSSLSYMQYLNDISFKLFTVKPLDFNTVDHDVITSTFEYVNDGFDCNIEVTWESNDASLFHNISKSMKLYAYSGYRNFSTVSTNHVEVCGISFFGSEENDTCLFYPYFKQASNVTFLSIKINARSYNTSSIPIPSTANLDMYPIHVSDFNFSSSIETDADGKDFYNIEMYLVKPTANLLTFAIYKLPAERSCY